MGTVVSFMGEAALLACSVSVDLNPVRAGIATTPEESQFTSGWDRILSKKCVMLLDWDGPGLRRDKRGAIPDDLAPILDRLGVDRSNCVHRVREFGRMFKQAAGRASSLAHAAPRCSRCWFEGKAAAQLAFM